MDDTRTSFPPLHLIICRQDGSKLAAELAGALRNAIRGNVTNEDVYLATLGDLPIPLRDFSSGPTEEKLMPDTLLDRALHSLVVVLLDKSLESDKAWQTWLKACEEKVADSEGRHQLVFLCLSDEIKDRLNRDNPSAKDRFCDIVGYDDQQPDNQSAFGEHAERAAWFALYVFQSCRQLLTKEVFDSGTDVEKQKLRLFISHAKKDSLPLANSVRYALEKKDYFNAWYDAVDLAGKKNWRQAIRDGVSNSVVVVLRTEKYDTRPWCRQEFLWAEHCGVPIVCVEARNSLVIQADALATGRVPTVRIPDGNLFRVLFQALKESLRILRLERLAKEWRKQHSGLNRAQQLELIPYTPNLKQLALTSQEIKQKTGKKKDSKYSIILYADPPLSTELYQASKRFVETESEMPTYLLTPSLLPFWESKNAEDPKNVSTRSLSKQRVNISISEEVRDLARLGFTVEDVNDFTVQIAEVIIANEGIVALGHDWREGGVMDGIYRFAEEHQDVVLEESERKGLVENYLFWGCQPGLEKRERGHLEGVLDFVFCERPEDERFEGAESLGDVPGPLHGYAVARSLTVMRNQMTSRSFARICLGGRDMDPRFPDLGPSGRCPGVVEEAYFSCLVDQPLYLSGLLGGVSGQVINALMKKDANLAFKLPEPVARNYPSGDQRPGDLDYDGPLDSENLLAYFGEYGIDRISENNQLSQKENEQLFSAATLDEVRDLILRGLSRLVA